MEKEGRDNGNKPKEYFINIDPKETPQSTLRMIRALYAIGADIIRVRFKNIPDAAKFKNDIKNLARDHFLGSEIIDETVDEITLQILIKHSEFPIEKAVRRMAIVALAANRDAIAALKDRSTVLFDSVIGAHNDVNRLGLYIVRQLKYGIERNLYRELGFRTPKEFLKIPLSPSLKALIPSVSKHGNFECQSDEKANSNPAVKSVWVTRVLV